MAVLLKTGTRIGLVGGTVYCTNKLGVWGDSSHTEKLYKDIHLLISPYLQSVPVEVPELPHITDITSKGKTYWNSMVLGAGKFVLNLPHHFSSSIKQVYNLLSEQLDSSSESS